MNGANVGLLESQPASQPIETHHFSELVAPQVQSFQLCKFVHASAEREGERERDREGGKERQGEKDGEREGETDKQIGRASCRERV